MDNFQGNFMSALKGGYQFGQQIKQQRDQQNINQLAGQAYGAPEEQRSQLLGQMAGINPQAAREQEKAFEQGDERRNRSMVNMAKLLMNAPEQARPGLWRSFVPALARFGVSELPQDYNPETAPVINQAADSIVKAYGGTQGASGILSTYVDDQGRRVAVNRDGTTSVLGGADQGMAQQTITVNGPDGRPAQYTFNKRTGSYEPATLGGGQAPPQADSFVPGEDGSQIPMQTVRGADGQVYRVQVGDPNAAQAGAADMGAGGQASSVQFPQRNVQPGGASPFVGRSPEEDAAAVEAAKQRAQLQYLPQELGMRSAAAVEQARGTEMAKTEAELAAEASKRGTNAQRDITQIDEALEVLPRASGGMLAAGRDRAAGAMNISTEGAQANAQLKLIAASLIANVPRFEGPQSNIDVQFYREAAGDLANEMLPVETRMAAAQKLKELRQKAAGQQGGASAEAAPVRIQSADDYNALPSGAEFIAPDGTRRRKR